MLADWVELLIKKKDVGLDRDLNPGPRAPEARIIPLDHQADDVHGSESIG